MFGARRPIRKWWARAAPLQHKEGGAKSAVHSQRHFVSCSIVLPAVAGCPTREHRAASPTPRKHAPL